MSTKQVKSAIGIPITESDQQLNGVDEMTAVVYQIRDYQSPKDLERMQRELEKEAAKIMVPFVETVGFTETIPFGGAGIDGMYLAPEKDPA